MEREENRRQRCQEKRIRYYLKKLGMRLERYSNCATAIRVEHVHIADTLGELEAWARKEARAKAERAARKPIVKQWRRPRRK